MEELLTGKKNYKLSYLPEHEKYIDKLIEILNNHDEEKKTAIKIILDNLKRDTWEHPQRISKQQEINKKNKGQDKSLKPKNIICLKCWKIGSDTCFC